jgi:hypothetical protein
MLIYLKTLGAVINHQKWEIESASRPPCGFWKIDERQLEV